jgi:hypothetical protein
MVASEHPVSETEKREALETVLTSATFARSAQLRAFLRHICEMELAGRSEELTEYQIAVDVLGRRKDVNLSEDSTVRNRAYELRQRLEKFYGTENPGVAVRIAIPRGGYVPYYTRHAAAEIMAPLPATQQAVIDVSPAKRRPRWWAVVATAIVLFGIGLIGGYLAGRPHPSAIVREAWGPLAQADDDFLISIATNMHLIVRPHIGNYPLRLPVPEQIYSLYGPNRPLPPGTPLYMEPAQLSIPLGELSATATLCTTRTSFGGTYQILSESEAPVTALRGRNAVLVGSGTNSRAAAFLLRNLPYTIDYTPDDRFAVFDQRKPPGQNELFLSQPVGDPVPSVLYGLLSVITTTDRSGVTRRTVVVSGSGSAGVQAAVEFFCSPASMNEMKERFRAAGLKGFPGTYQVVVRCRTSGIRLISYEYATHVMVK